MALFLSQGEHIARLLHLRGLLRINVAPVQIAPPWGVTVFDLRGRLPLPAKISIEVLAPIDGREELGGAGGDPGAGYELIVDDGLDTQHPPSTETSSSVRTSTTSPACTCSTATFLKAIVDAQLRASARAGPARSARGAPVWTRSPQAKPHQRTSTRSRPPRAHGSAPAAPTIATSAIVSTPRLCSTTTVRQPRRPAPPPALRPSHATLSGRRAPRPPRTTHRPPRARQERSTPGPAPDAQPTPEFLPEPVTASLAKLARTREGRRGCAISSRQLRSGNQTGYP